MQASALHMRQRKVYLEYGNEVWNTDPGFKDAFNHVQEYATAHGIGHPKAAGALALHMWQIWESVYGPSQAPARLVRVFAGQFNVPWTIFKALEYITIQPACLKDPHHCVDAISGAPYFSARDVSSTFNANTTAHDIDAAVLNGIFFATKLANFVAMRDEWSKILGFHLPIFMYEGGLGMSVAHQPEPLSWYQAYLDCVNDPLMGTIYTTWLNDLQNSGIEGIMISMTLVSILNLACGEC